MVPKEITVGGVVWVYTNQLTYRRAYPKMLESLAYSLAIKQDLQQGMALELLNYLENHQNELVRVSYEIRSGWESGMDECNIAFLTATFYQYGWDREV